MGSETINQLHVIHELGKNDECHDACNHSLNVNVFVKKLVPREHAVPDAEDKLNPVPSSREVAKFLVVKGFGEEADLDAGRTKVQGRECLLQTKVLVSVIDSYCFQVVVNDEVSVVFIDLHRCNKNNQRNDVERNQKVDTYSSEPVVEVLYHHHHGGEFVEIKISLVEQCSQELMTVLLVFDYPFYSHPYYVHRIALCSFAFVLIHHVLEEDLVHVQSF